MHHILLALPRYNFHKQNINGQTITEMNIDVKARLYIISTHESICLHHVIEDNRQLQDGYRRNPSNVLFQLHSHECCGILFYISVINLTICWQYLVGVDTSLVNASNGNVYLKCMRRTNKNTESCFEDDTPMYKSIRRSDEWIPDCIQVIANFPGNIRQMVHLD